MPRSAWQHSWRRHWSEFFGVFLAVYLGHIGDVIDILDNWYHFGVDAGQEVGFEQSISGLFVVYNYHLLVLGFAVTFLFSLAIVATDKDQRRSHAPWRS